MTTVGFVGPMPPIRSGIAHHSAQLVGAMRELGATTEVYSWRSQYPRALYRRSQIEASSAVDPSVQWTLRWWDPISWRATGRALRSTDRLVIPWTVPFHGPHYIAVARAADVPLTLMVHNATPHEPMIGADHIAAPLFRRAASIVTQSRSVADECRRLAPDTPVIVVATPPNFAVVPQPLPPRPLKLLMLGYVRDYKGVDVALAAMRRLLDSGQSLSLTVAGEVWDGHAGPWYELVRSLQLEDHVELHLTYQSDERVAELLATHHVLLAPYRSATQSGVVAQALAAGRPVVATEVGGLPDQVREQDNGALAKPGDEASLADAVVRVSARLEMLAAGAVDNAPRWTDVAAAFLGEHEGSFEVLT